MSVDIDKKDLKRVDKVKTQEGWENVIGYSTEECGLLYFESEKFVDALGLKEVKYYDEDTYEEGLNPKMQVKPPSEYTQHESESFDIVLMIKDGKHFYNVCKTNQSQIWNIIKNLNYNPHNYNLKFRIVKEEENDISEDGIFCPKLVFGIDFYNKSKPSCKNRKNDNERQEPCVCPDSLEKCPYYDKE